jgi:ribosomal protein S17E
MASQRERVAGYHTAQKERKEKEAEREELKREIKRELKDS